MTDFTVGVDRTIVAKRVDDTELVNLLGEPFGTRYSLIEKLVVHWLWELTDHYIDDRWRFYSLSNDGFYMAPNIESSLHVSCKNDFFNGELSSEAAGIVATLYGLNDLTSVDHSSWTAGSYRKLIEFADQHREARLIWRAID